MTDFDEQQVRQQVLALINELAPGPLDDAEPGTSLIEGLGYHSLALLELAFALEDEFDLEPISEETARQITTVGLVQDTVVARLAERHAAALNAG